MCLRSSSFACTPSLAAIFQERRPPAIQILLCPHQPQAGLLCTGSHHMLKNPRLTTTFRIHREHHTLVDLLIIFTDERASSTSCNSRISELGTRGGDGYCQVWATLQHLHVSNNRECHGTGKPWDLLFLRRTLRRYQRRDGNFAIFFQRQYRDHH
ncbi:hypothetical protein PAXRUDRAFT_719429 [Paxillus rubicundulus Ve08.2h10]|uniref:Uncharacterized protein n=1 Tax=Paxillus rubicundulus Ve08.2h10 TaxID=930991 RepID=A0A0D0DKR3_9AGAM|nr:hypothetical protein PAXRUDRAFT_719429 [Paxillus rubicundulus Ve08.2h10]